MNKGRIEPLKDQKAVVLGGSRGLGLCVVQALVEGGAAVTVGARNADRLTMVGERNGVSPIAGDITDGDFARSV